jgi:hypothetical protein
VLQCRIAWDCSSNSCSMRVGTEARFLRALKVTVGGVKSSVEDSVALTMLLMALIAARGLCSVCV